MNPQEVVYSFPRYQTEASGVWYEKENQSLTAFLGNFPNSFSADCADSDKDPPTALDNNSTSCVTACSSIPVQKSADELSENCSIQLNKNENSEIKTGGKSGAPKVKKTKPKPMMTIAEYFELERHAPNKRPLRRRSVPWWSIPISRFPDRSRYNSSLRFRVYGFLTHHDLWGVPISHPMIPRLVQETVWNYGMEQEKEFRNHQRWISLDYFPNHARDCWLCMNYSDREYMIPEFGYYSYNSEFFGDSDFDFFW